MNSVDTLTSLFWGYLLIWTLIVAYIIVLGVRVAKIGRDIEALRAAREGKNNSPEKKG